MVILTFMSVATLVGLVSYNSFSKPLLIDVTYWSFLNTEIWFIILYHFSLSYFFPLKLFGDVLLIDGEFVLIVWTSAEVEAIMRRTITYASSFMIYLGWQFQVKFPSLIVAVLLPLTWIWHQRWRPRRPRWTSTYVYSSRNSSRVISTWILGVPAASERYSWFTWMSEVNLTLLCLTSSKILPNSVRYAKLL